ncbi:hypothetical protein BGX34_007776, partial [Mortierella sp. NVP85]
MYGCDPRVQADIESYMNLFQREADRAHQPIGPAATTLFDAEAEVTEAWVALQEGTDLLRRTMPSGTSYTVGWSTVEYDAHALTTQEYANDGVITPVTGLVSCEVKAIGRGRDYATATKHASRKAKAHAEKEAVAQSVINAGRRYRSAIISGRLSGDVQSAPISETTKCLGRTTPRKMRMYTLPRTDAITLPVPQCVIVEDEVKPIASKRIVMTADTSVPDDDESEETEIATDTPVPISKAPKKTAPTPPVAT